MTHSETDTGIRIPRSSPPLGRDGSQSSNSSAERSSTSDDLAVPVSVQLSAVLAS